MLLKICYSRPYSSMFASWAKVGVRHYVVGVRHHPKAYAYVSVNNFLFFSLFHFSFLFIYLDFYETYNEFKHSNSINLGVKELM